MKTKLIILAVISWCLLPLSGYSQGDAPRTNSNGTIEIIALHLPDSVVFKPAAGVKISSKELSISLVSGTESYSAKYSVTSGTMGLNFDGSPVYRDDSRVAAIMFNAPAGFKPQKIKFGLPGKTMYYNIDKSEWEPDVAEEAPAATTATPAAEAQDDGNQAQNAGSAPVNVNEDTNIPLEQYSYLIPPKDNIIIAVADSGAVSFDPQRIALIRPGMHSFEILVQTITHMSSGGGSSTGSTVRSGNTSVTVSANTGFASDMTTYSNTVKVSAVFEAGKYYTIDCKTHYNWKKLATEITEASIVEVTDSKTLAKWEKKLASSKNNVLNTGWAQANPNALDGTYTSKDGKAEITFTDNRFAISTPSILGHFEYEGTFFFNENAITLKIDSMKFAKKKKVLLNKITFLSYKLYNGALNITGVWGESNGIMPSVKTIYYNGNVTETTGNNASGNAETNTAPVGNSVAPMGNPAAFSKAHPDLLEGTYKTQNGKKEITFTGNTFHLVLPTLMAHYIYDGTFLFDGATIILNVNSYKYGKMKMKVNYTVTLDYQLNDNILEITHSDAVGIFSVKGQYHKVNGQE